MRRSCLTRPSKRGETGWLLVTLSSGSIFTAHPAWGAPSDIAVRMKCPVLSEVSAAEFEARAKVDLSVRAPHGGELEVVCDELAARIRWRERDRAWFARSMPPTATPATLVDALLVASKELVEEASRFEESASADAGKEPRGATDPIPPSPADVASSPAGDGTPGRAGESLQPGNRPRHRATMEPETGASRDRPSAAPVATPEWSWGVSAAAQAALFDGQGKGMFGPSVGVYAQWPAGFFASLAGSYDLALGAGDVVSVRVASAAAVIGTQFGPARSIELGVGGLVGGVMVDAAAPYQPTSGSQLLWGVIARGRYALQRNRWRFAAGPELHFHGFRPAVAVNGTTVWGVPAVSVGLTLEVSRDLYGSR